MSSRHPSLQEGGHLGGGLVSSRRIGLVETRGFTQGVTALQLALPPLRYSGPYDAQNQHVRVIWSPLITFVNTSGSSLATTQWGRPDML